MALVFSDSFDHYATADLLEKWTNKSDAPAVGAYGRNSTNGLRCVATNTLSTADAVLRGIPASASGLVAFAINPSAPGGHTVIFRAYDGPSDLVQFYVTLGADGSLNVYRQSASYLGWWPVVTSAVLLGGSGGGVITFGQWNYVEIKFTVGNTGSVYVRVDNVAVISLASVDNMASAVATVTGVVLGAYATTNSSPFMTADFDDVTVWDLTSPNNDFMGDLRVDAHYPSGAGATTGWTPSAGSNWDCVDDGDTPNDDTDYVSTSTLNAVDTYAFDDLVNAGGTIKAIQVLASAKKADSGTCAVAPVIRRGSTDYAGDGDGLGVNYAYAVRQCYDVDPSTSAAWTESDFNGAEFGIKKTA